MIFLEANLLALVRKDCRPEKTIHNEQLIINVTIYDLATFSL